MIHQQQGAKRPKPQPPRPQPPKTRGRALMFAAALVMTGFGVSPAHADWYKAESERFVVYSDGAEAPLRRFVQKLEVYDRVLRIRLGLNPNEGPARRLPIYLVGARSGLLRVNPAVGENVAGFYTTTDDDIFAIAIRETGDDTLLHEYAHHFMFENAAYPYPGWFVEGFAEYYATADVKSDRVLVGQASANRGYWLMNSKWIPISTLLANRPNTNTKSDPTYYPLAWLLTHWFWGNPERQPQLDAYLRDVGAGGDPVDAMQRATGLTLDQLRRELRTYMSGRLPYQAMVMPIPNIPVTVTRLPRSANDLLLLGQRLKSGRITEDQQAVVLAEVRRIAASYPDDTLASLTLARAEMAFGDPVQGQTILKALLDREPDNVEGLQLISEAELKASYQADDPDEAVRLRSQARQYLGRAFKADESSYQTYPLLAQTRMASPDYPNENDMATLELAYQLAPQLPGTVINYAMALSETGKKEQALTILQPLANNPHGDGGSSAAQSLINRIKGVTDAQQEAEDAAKSAQPDDPEPEAP